ncbi:hypothetical protein wVul_1355 [Wolbachia endosymbiont of Armadillidium vulgare str. wVulC]|uniref:Uncharacterized protein n=1 Tax=Wolbachia endosymbiont of Armadillidium arcangelii TaxID=3158571 RepID=A0AAU7Q303_9RICK|nr:hypothetical protein [Wolbachia endosymbiont of Armadillidium vulgare]KLT21610.1 hypothetical protein wVul_1355 [Wolbachia endosymbiont of Armadillidium vulgare str. wVulC]OJH30614.1 hypothetical protein Wxf_02940 [Armadillidium vulgare] [Wolbachia endosymbiont of Armadillidium vulgare]OJH30953.1 hypothetical protein Wxf_00325 [Wolbachia endosymbiont of Armadillidium vulgare]
MLAFEQVQSLESEQQKLQGNVLEKNSQRFGEKFIPTAAIHEHVDEKMADNIFAGLRDMYTVEFEYNIASDKPITVAVENMAEGFQKSIKHWKQEKIMFSAPVYVSRGDGPILDYMIKKLHHLKNNDVNINEDGKRKLEPVLSEVYDLVSKGNHVSEKVLKLLPEGIIEKRKEYLQNLKKIASESIDHGEKDRVIVERDNAFYCVKYSEKSIVSPAKFLNNSEFQNLEGILKVGKDNTIKIRDGQYHGVKGKVKMTFEVGDEKIEMVLFSEKAEDFGNIMVHMDDKSCEVFLKHCAELEKETRISKVIEAAKSFVQTKSNAPSSNLDDTNLSQHSKEVLTV